MKEYIVTVMARDRVGIIRDVSTAITNLDGNITHVSQTVMRGYFTLIMSIQMPDERTMLEIRQCIERSGEVGELEVNVRPFIESTPDKSVPSERFALSLRGIDRKGIICRVAGFLAERGVNVDDFYGFVQDGILVYLLQVSIPVGMNIDEIRNGIEDILKDFNLAVHLQHENIFRATSEICPVMDLEKG